MGFEPLSNDFFPQINTLKNIIENLKNSFWLSNIMGSGYYGKMQYETYVSYIKSGSCITNKSVYF